MLKIPKVATVALTAMMANCVNAQNTIADSQGTKPKIRKVAYFDNPEIGSLFYNFEYLVSGFTNSHSAINITDCSNARFFCYEGDFLVVFPRSCEQRVPGEIFASPNGQLFRRNSEIDDLGRLFFVNESASTTFSQGVFFGEHGFEGVWMSEETNPTLIEISTIWQLRDPGGLVSCDAITSK